MTKEQAIEILRCNTDLGNGVIIENESTQSIYEALDMAIKALEQDVTDTNVGKIDSDCVSRASVKELFQEGCVMGMYDFLGIDDLPPVTPTQRWIPVSERLPDTHEEVLCWYEYYHWSQEKVLPEYGIGYYSKDAEIWCGEVASGINAKVLAWQPLPQPYEEKRGDENGSN